MALCRCRRRFYRRHRDATRETSNALATAQRIEIRGTVQGVGFRPYIVRLATALGIDGWVRNAGGYVVIEASGSRNALTDLVRRIPAEAPPHAVVSSVLAADIDQSERTVSRGFRALKSVALSGRREVPPDLAMCEDCSRELFDVANRRYRYPFINCTNCGPRASVIVELPYDRSRTTMDPFVLCDACADEYADPSDRRFHAEPVACPACGPQLSWSTAGAVPAVESHGEQGLAAAVARIASGEIVALKGLGGYQLVCDATNPAAVRRLRDRKARPAKPFAVMVQDLPSAREVAVLGETEERLLASAAAPIVLTESRLQRDDAESGCDNPAGPALTGVHPGTRRVGIFLPYTPLHHLLMHDLSRPLVVTSGNRSGEPIAIDDGDAFNRLNDIADGFLSHDRGIRSRYDDSVVMAVRGKAAVVRRARGFAPVHLPIPHRADRPVLAMGAQLKHTFALVRGENTVLSPHIGDLRDLATFHAFARSLEQLSALVGIEPELVVHDMHPAYSSTQHALKWSADRRLAIQHHHAHVASCAAEHGITDPFIGVAYDGLGWGDDGTFWGGEILVADLGGYQRVGRFARAPLPGGEAAVHRPARMALGYLYGAETFGSSSNSPAIAEDLVATFARRLPQREVETVRRMVLAGFNSPLASSAGRLFDAVSSIAGLRNVASYEGEAAIALEAAAATEAVAAGAELPWRLVRSGEMWVYDPVPTVTAALEHVANGGTAGRLAAAFHATIKAVTVAMCQHTAERTGIRVVCLSGGVFQNRLLTESIATGLQGQGFIVFCNQQVPANDGGISYGQAAVAAARQRGG